MEDQPKPTSKMPQQPFVPKSSDDKQSTWRELLSTIGVFVVALLVAFCLIAFVFQSYEVDGPSMQSTLHNQDRLIVWKTPRTWSRITGHQYVPNRGDIVIFTESGLSSFGQADSKQLIKRVVGLPGDRIVVKDGLVTVYNSEHPKGFNPDTTLPYSKQLDSTYTIGNIDVTLGNDELFVCGDNRGNSLDSRLFGPINTDQIIGKLVARIYPFGDAEKF